MLVIQQECYPGSFPTSILSQGNLAWVALEIVPLLSYRAAFGPNQKCLALASWCAGWAIKRP
jgi:hypothetical protein